MSFKENAQVVLGRERPIALYLGFNPVTCQADVVLQTEAGYCFIPMEEPIELAGGVWSARVFLRLCSAQEQLSAFLRSLAEDLHTTSVDRCLYAEWLNFELDFLPGRCSQREEVLCVEKQRWFRDTYRKQLEDMRQFGSWIEYHNQGFAYRYYSSVAVGGAIHEIYRYRKILEAHGCWPEARAVIDQLRSIASTDKPWPLASKGRHSEKNVDNRTDCR